MHTPERAQDYLLHIEDLYKSYGDKVILDNIDLSVANGELCTVVGPSGCGKSTMARVVLGLYPPNSGEIYYQNHRIDNLTPQKMLPYRSKMQMIFQDPYASLNPRMTVKRTLEEPVIFHRKGIKPREVEDKVAEVMQQVGVEPGWATRYPHEFSGGQRQRISIARALMVDPEFIVADEPVSALDVSIQAQILNLLMEAQEIRGLTYMFITHDLSVVEHISSRVAVMYLGTICELALTKSLFDSPRHPYTQALLSAVQVVALLDDRREVQFVPRGLVPPAEIVAGLEAVPAQEVELPHVLAHGVPPDTAAHAEVDVVVDVAVVDKGGGHDSSVGSLADNLRQPVFEIVGVGDKAGAV